MNDAYLSHYGILGMKWGVRRSPEQLGHKIEKLENKKDKLRYRIERNENRRARKNIELRTAKNEEKLAKARFKVQDYEYKVENSLTRWGSNRAAKKARKYRDKLRVAMREKSKILSETAKFDRKKMVLEHKIGSLDVKINSLNEEMVKLGREILSE